MYLGVGDDFVFLFRNDIIFEFLNVWKYRGVRYSFDRFFMYVVERILM